MPTIKIRKPYDKHLDEMLREGSSIITGFNNAGYLMRMGKQHNICRIYKLKSDKFVLTPQKPIKKETKKGGRKYSHYKIYNKTWPCFLIE